VSPDPPEHSPPGTGPRWRRIQLALEQDIRTGVVAPGERLPTEAVLARRFGVHRNTIRRAIERLRAKELVRVEHGRGTFVREAAISYAVGIRTRLTTAVLVETRAPARRVLASAPVRADGRTAAALCVPVGSPLLRVEMLRLVDDKPVAIGTYFYPLPRFKGIARLIGELGSITEALRRGGVNELVRKSLRVKASLPSQADAKALGVSRTKPVLELTSVSADERGVPVQISRSRIVSARIDLVFEFRDPTP